MRQRQNSSQREQTQKTTDQQHGHHQIPEMTSRFPEG